MSETTLLISETNIYDCPIGRVDLEELFNLPTYEAEPSLAISVPEMIEDRAVRAEASQFMAAVLADRLIEAEPSVRRPIESLFEGIKLAAKGDPVAKKLVEINATTDIIERSIKTGFILSPVELELTPSGRPIQHDQTLDSVQANSLRLMADHAIMGPRTKAETRNSFRISALNQEGYFDNDYSFIVISPAENLPEAGFFTETMSCAIQVTSKSENGLKLETAFISGIKALGEERHDIETISSFYNRFGVDTANKTTAQIIDTPLLIHNSLIPNGAIDIVKILDDCADGTFFGESKPRQDYLQYVNVCHQKERQFMPKGKKIAAELISEADSIDTTLKAIKRLNKLSGKNAVDHAIEDPSIDLRVFGEIAAMHIEQTRAYMNMGNFDQAAKERAFAVMTENSFSCPSAMSDALSQETSESGEDEYGSLNFKCPSCGQTNTRPRGRLISNCQACHSDVTCG